MYDIMIENKGRCMFKEFKRKSRSADPKYKMIFDEKKLIRPDFFDFEHKNENYTAIFEGVSLEDDKGYIELRLTLTQSDHIVGYIKTFHIPKESFDFLYPDVLHWANKFQGLNINLYRHPRDLDYHEEKTWEDKSYEEKIHILISGFKHISFGAYKDIQARLDNGKIDPEKEYVLLNKLITKLYGKEFDTAKQSYNKSQVQFSRIYNENDQDRGINSKAISEYCLSRNITAEQLNKTTGKNYQGKGLAKKMYKLMADYLGLNDLVLTKGFVNDQSSPVWEYNIKNSPDFNHININGIDMVDHRQKDLTYLYHNKKTITQKNKSSTKKRMKFS